MRNALAACLVGLIAGCSPPAATGLSLPGSGTRAGPLGDPLLTSGLPGSLGGEASDQYYPLQPFFSWTYAVQIVSNGATTSAEDVVRIESLSSGGTRTGTLSIKRTIGGNLVFDGIGALQVSGTEVSISRDGPAEIIKLPLKAGNEWSSGTLKARSFKVARLVAGGKTYQDLIGISYSKDGEVVAVRYLAPGVGIVKQLTRGKADSAVVETHSELTSARIVAVAKVTLTPAASFSLTPGATAAISAVVAMAEEGLYSQDLSFSSSNALIAAVVKGTSAPTGLKATVTAISTGSATITAKSDQDPTKLATISVEVK
ncbi:MAG: hypothetical protein FJZ01_25050 [Candidatus Sericytochromatia bacterium]|nr:hypothetical protein [Candidatus Tanganyikabacteria bacterium]